MFEGKPVGTPDAGTFWRIIDEHNVSVLFTAPTAFRAIKRLDPMGEFSKKYDLNSLKAMFLAGKELTQIRLNGLKTCLAYQLSIIGGKLKQAS